MYYIIRISINNKIIRTWINWCKYDDDIGFLMDDIGMNMTFKCH